ncbi:hypothetical protein HID58_045723, partial [Brassica napus]
ITDASLMSTSRRVKPTMNHELNDKKRLATSGAGFARAFTVQFGSCKFSENFIGCQDLAKQKMKKLSCPFTTNLRIFGVRMRRQRQVQVWFQCFLEMVNMSCLLF